MPSKPAARFPLDLAFTGDVRSLVRHEVNSREFRLQNIGQRTSPTMTLTFEYEEHGPSPVASPLRWIQSTPIKVPRLVPRGEWQSTIYMMPVIDGLLKCTFTVADVSGKRYEPSDVELRGFRSSGKPSAEFYFYVVSPETRDSVAVLKSIFDKQQG